MAAFSIIVMIVLVIVASPRELEGRSVAVDVAPAELAPTLSPEEAKHIYLKKR